MNTANVLERLYWETITQIQYVRNNITQIEIEVYFNQLLESGIREISDEISDLASLTDEN